MQGGEAPQFHQLAPEGQQPRPPEREGEEHRRGRRNRGGRDRNRGDRPREEQAPVAASASIIEEQRRIHALEAQREQERRAPEEHGSETPRMEEPRREDIPEPRREDVQPVEPPAFLVKQAPRSEEPRSEEPRGEELRPSQPAPAPLPRREEPRINPKELLESAGLLMIETDRSKAPAQPQSEEPVQLGRPRRERPKPQQDEELKQVETKH